MVKAVHERPLGLYVVVLLAISVLATGCGSRVTGTSTQQAGAVGQRSSGDNAPSGDQQDLGAAGTDPGAAATGGVAGSGSAAGGGTTAGAAAGASGAKAATSGGSKSTASADASLPDSVKISGPSSQGVSDSEIKVGVLAPLSGVAGFLGENELDAVKAYLSDVNARGGVRGRKYRIISADTRFEPATEATAARRLVEEEQVFFLVSTFSDSIGPYVTSKGIPNMTFGIVPPAFSSKYPTTYPIGLNTVDSINQMAYLQTQVLKQPIKTTAIVYETSNIPWGQWPDYAVKAWTQWGVDVKSVDRFNVSDGDCTSLVLKVRNLNIDYWQLANSLGWPLCQQAMARQNWAPKFGRGGPYTADEHFVGQAGQASDGVYALTNGVQIAQNKGTPFPYDPSGVAPEVDHFVETMKKYSPKSSDMGSLENIWSQDFWSQGKLINESIRRQSDAITWKGVNQWIQSQTAWNGGLVAPSSFKPTCKTGSSPVWMFQWKWDGQKLVQSDWKPYGGPQPMPTKAKDAVVPGAGDCYMTAMADAKL